MATQHFSFWVEVGGKVGVATRDYAVTLPEALGHWVSNDITKINVSPVLQSTE